MNENTRVVQRAYEAFGRGDIQSVLNALADDVEWHSPGPAEILPRCLGNAWFSLHDIPLALPGPPPEGITVTQKVLFIM